MDHIADMCSTQGNTATIQLSQGTGSQNSTYCCVLWYIYRWLSRGEVHIETVVIWLLLINWRCPRIKTRNCNNLNQNWNFAMRKREKSDFLNSNAKVMSQQQHHKVPWNLHCPQISRQLRSRFPSLLGWDATFLKRWVPIDTSPTKYKIGPKMETWVLYI